MIYGTILCVGDSLLTGARDEYDLSVPMLLGDCLSRGSQQWIAIDEAVNGETSGSLLRHLYKTVRGYPEAKDVIICVGTNDAKIPALPDNHFIRNYIEILKTLTILGRRAFMCTVPQREGFGAPDRINAEAVDRYNECISNLAMIDSSMTIVDIRKIPKGYRPDGIHFNNKGNQWVAKKIAETLICSY